MNKREQLEAIDHAILEIWKLIDGMDNSDKNQKRANTIIGKLYDLYWIIDSET